MFGNAQEEQENQMTETDGNAATADDRSPLQRAVAGATLAQERQQDPVIPRPIIEKKLNTRIEELCKECPPQFSQYMVHRRTLQYDETPDYEFLRSIFQELFEQEGMGLLSRDVRPDPQP